MADLVNGGFWAGRRVLVTGHTGFKGAWLVLWLRALGAEVTGLADGVPTEPSLYALARAGDGLRADVRADVRDGEAVAAALSDARAEVILHLAAQPLVRRGWREPGETFAVNVMGTVAVLEAARRAPEALAVVVVTSDKAYANPPGRPPRPFVETDPLGGADPYSASKACAEHAVAAYAAAGAASGDRGGAGCPAPLATARAGNVVGGGDWGEDRLVPDLMRAAAEGGTVAIRNPEAIRPWQHVLEPLSGYLALAEALAGDPAFAGGWNFGPAPGDARTVGWVAGAVAERWDGPLGWAPDPGPHPVEAAFLSLDCAKAAERLGWRPRWSLETAFDAVVAWHAALRDGEDPRAVALAQIDAFAAAG